MSAIIARSIWLAAGLVAGAGLFSPFAVAQDAPPGTRIEVKPDSLPPPYATPSTANRAQPIEDRGGRMPRAPEGFSVNLFAERLEHARWLAVAPNGDVFLAEPRAGHVRILRDADGDGRAETSQVFVGGLQRPHGLAFHGDHLYVADVNAVWRLPYKPGELKASAKPEQVTARGPSAAPAGTGRAISPSRRTAAGSCLDRLRRQHRGGAFAARHRAGVLRRRQETADLRERIAQSGRDRLLPGHRRSLHRGQRARRHGRRTGARLS